MNSRGKGYNWLPLNEQPQQNRKNVKWWNDSCEIAVKARKKSLNKFKRHPSEVNRVKYKEAAQNSKEVILNSKHLLTLKPPKNFGIRFT